MQYSQGSIGRVFTIRLEGGDHLPDCIELFAKDQGIKAAYCLLLGGIDKGEIVVGPEDPEGAVINPVLKSIAGAHEVAAVGTLFNNENNEPILHMHATLGRGDSCHTGCIRPGVDIWLVGEFIIVEILDSGMLRKKDPTSGLALLAKE